MSKKRKYPTVEEKALVLKKYLVEKVPLSDLCDEYGLQPSQIYRWQKQLFENAPALFRRTNKRAEDAKDRKIVALEEKLVGWIGITQSKFYDWRDRYGKINEHNGWIPRDWWLTDWEKEAIIQARRRRARDSRSRWGRINIGISISLT